MIRTPWLVLWSLLLGTGVLIAGAAGRAKETPPSDTWPVYRGNPQHTGHVPTRVLPPLKLLWRTKVGGPRRRRGHDALLSLSRLQYPLVDGSGVYVAARTRAGDTPPFEGATLYALDPKTGVVRWKRNNIATTGCLVGDTLATVELDAAGGKGTNEVRHGWIVGLNTRTGALNWRQPISHRKLPFWEDSHITTDGKLVYSPEFIVDPATGAKVRTWEERWVSGAPAISGDTITTTRPTGTMLVLAGFDVILLDKKSLVEQGKVVEQSAVAGGTHAHTLLGSDPVDHIVSTRDDTDVSGKWHVFVADKKSKEKKDWRWATYASPNTPIVLCPYSKGHLLLLFRLYESLSSTRASIVQAYDLAGGKLVWEYLPLTVTGQPAAAGNVFYLPAGRNVGKKQERGGLYALAAENGKRLWEFQRPGLTFGSVAIAGGRVFTLGSDGYLYAFVGAAGKGEQR